MPSEDDTQDKEVLVLKKRLSQCQLERERLIKEKKRRTIKEKLLKRELEKVEEKLSTEIEADLNARSEFKKTQETLKEALENKGKSVSQLLNGLFKLFDKWNEIIRCPLSAKDNAKFHRLSADIEKTSLQSREETDKLDMLSSEMYAKNEEFCGFYETHLINLKISPTADVTTLLRDHFAAYFDTLNFGEHGYEMLTEFMQSILELEAAQRENEKSAAVGFKSSISAGMSKIFNFFLRKQTNSSGAVVDDRSYVGKMLIRYRIGNKFGIKAQDRTELAH